MNIYVTIYYTDKDIPKAILQRIFTSFRHWYIKLQCGGSDPAPDLAI